MVISNIIEEPDSRIRKWLDQLKSFRISAPITSMKKAEEINEDHISIAAYYLSLEKKSYETLCWILAEKLLKKTYITPTNNEIRKKAEEISGLGKSYDELCYLNAELDILTSKESI